jgi:hypothetical protein
VRNVCPGEKTFSLYAKNPIYAKRMAGKKERKKKVQGSLQLCFSRKKTSPPVDTFSNDDETYRAETAGVKCPAFMERRSAESGGSIHN